MVELCLSTQGSKFHAKKCKNEGMDGWIDGYMDRWMDG